MKKGGLILVIFSLILAGCANSNMQTINQNQQTIEIGLAEATAISIAKEKLGIVDFPSEPGKVAGIIQGGGPSPGIKVPGEFETQVTKDSDSSYIVTFTESWNGKDFHYSGQNGTTLSHYFKYKVTSSDVQQISSGGDFPPQLVR